MELLGPIHYEEYSDLQNMLDALDDEYSTNEESVIMSASVYFVILDAFWLISFIGGLVMTEWRSLVSDSRSSVRTILLWVFVQFCQFHMCTIQEQSRGKSFLERFLKKIDF